LLLLFSGIAKVAGAAIWIKSPVPFSPIGAVEHSVLQSSDVSAVKMQKTRFSLNAKTGFAPL